MRFSIFGYNFEMVFTKPIALTCTYCKSPHARNGILCYDNGSGAGDVYVCQKCVQIKWYEAEVATLNAIKKRGSLVKQEANA